EILSPKELLNTANQLGASGLEIASIRFLDKGSKTHLAPTNDAKTIDIKFTDHAEKSIKLLKQCADSCNIQVKVERKKEAGFLGNSSIHCILNLKILKN